MSTHYKFAAIFHTEIIKAPFAKIILDPVEIEYFSESRVLLAPANVDNIIPLEQGIDKFIPFIPNVQIHLPLGKYISITVHIELEEDNLYKANKYCDGFLDSTIAQLSCVYDSALFLTQIYRGQLLDGNESNSTMYGMLLAVNPVSIATDFMLEVIPDLRTSINSDQDIYDRYLLMSKFFAKSLTVPYGEEKFFYLWTILEIYPMKDSYKIHPIYEHLGRFMGKEPELVKDRLGIGYLCSTRGNLVHHGRLNIPSKDIVETLTRLELICIEVLRSMSGLRYSQSLDKYFIQN